MAARGAHYLAIIGADTDANDRVSIDIWKCTISAPSAVIACCIIRHFYSLWFLIRHVPSTYLGPLLYSS